MVPPPGVYDPRLLASGNKPFTDRAAKIGEKNNNSFHNAVLRNAKSRPGPGTYNLRKDLNSNDACGPKIRPSVLESGKNAPPKFVGRIDQEVPGPGEYAVDSYTRNRRLSKFGDKSSLRGFINDKLGERS